MIDRKQYDIGIVFVHGIGETLHGDTITKCALPLIRALDASLDDPTLKISVVHRESALHETPAFFEFEAGEKSIGIVESWWGGLVRKPKNRHFLFWAARSIPTVLMSHFDERYRRACHQYTHSPADTASHPAKFLLDVLGQGLLLFLEFAVLLLSLLTVPILLLLLVLLPVLSIVPGLGGIVDTIKGLLIAYIGDSQVFSEDGLHRIGIVGKVRSDIASMREKSIHCVVIAHSQGAAVAHKALRQLEDYREPVPDVFVSYGSGLRKLTELRSYVSLGRKPWWLAILSTLCALASVTFIAGVIIPSSANGIENAVALLGYSIAMCAFGLSLRMGVHFLVMHKTALKKERESSPPNMPDTNAGWVQRSASLNWLGLLTIPVFAYVWHPDRVFEGGWINDTLGVNVWIVLPILLGLSFTLVMQWRYAVGRASSRWRHRSNDIRNWNNHYNLNNLAWYDFYANYDPVPNGPLFDTLPAGNAQAAQSIVAKNYHPRQVVNEFSIASDHNAYWANMREFVCPVARLVWFGADKDATPIPNSLHLATKRESAYRVSSLVAIYLVLTYAFDEGWYEVLKNHPLHEQIHQFVYSRCSDSSIDGVTRSICSPGWLPNTLETSVSHLIPALSTVAVLFGSVRLLQILAKRLHFLDK